MQEKIPLEYPKDGSTNQFTLPQEVFVEMYDADFCSSATMQDEYLIVNFGRRDARDPNLVTFYIIILEPETEATHVSYTCNLLESKDTKQLKIKANNVVRFAVRQKAGFRERIKDSTDENVIKLWKEVMLKDASEKLLNYVKAKPKK